MAEQSFVVQEKLNELRAEIRRELRVTDELRGDLDRVRERLARTKVRLKVLAERYEQLSQARIYSQGPMP